MDRDEALRLIGFVTYREWQARFRGESAPGPPGARLDEHDFALAYKERALDWIRKAEYGRAVDDLGEAIRRDPCSENHSFYYSTRAGLYRAAGETDKALADLGEAIRLDQNSAYEGCYYHVSRCRVWLDKGGYGKALADLDEAIRLQQYYERIWAKLGDRCPVDGVYAEAFGLRALIRAACPNRAYRDGTRAVEAGTHACVLARWKSPLNLGALAAAYAESGDFARAVEYQERVTSLPNGEENHPRLRPYEGSSRLALYEEGLARLVLYRAGRPYRLMPGAW